MFVREYVAPSGGDSFNTSGRGSETILLVEDDTDVRIATRRLLERMGYHVLDAGTPQAAIDLAVVHRGAIDMVISDVIMPDMNGGDVVAQIRTLRPRVPVLFMSAHADEETIERFNLKGPKTSFIAKPFDLATLSAKIREVLAVGN